MRASIITATDNGSRATVQLGAESVRFVTVCRANVSRSPLTEVALRLAAADHGVEGAVSTCSAGVAARRGQSAAPEAVAIARRYGVDLTLHRSRHVDDLEFTDRDVVVAMTRTQRDHLHTALPPDRVFTLPELADLLDHTDASWFAEPDDLLASAAAHRPMLAPGRDQHVADPTGRGRRAFDRAWREILDAADAVCSALAVTLTGHVD